MAMMHLYAVIPARKEARLGVVGVDQREVRCIAAGNFAAVVGGAPLPDYRDIDRKQAIGYLLAHQRVVETVMREHRLLPVKFGTILPDEHSVLRLLAQGADVFRTALTRLESKIQVEVMALWNLNAVLQEAAREDSVVRFKSAAATATKAVGVEDQVALGKMVYSLVEERRASLKDSLVSRLREVACDVIVNPDMDESMVMNLALLVEDNARDLLDARLRELDTEFGGKLNFRCVGPLPPYSFATVEVKVPTFYEVDKARRLLELGERHHRSEIKQAYRRLVGPIHPDICPDNPEADGLVSDLASAYRLLMSYADSSGGGEPMVCSFDRRTVERTVMISICRQESRS